VGGGQDVTRLHLAPLPLSPRTTSTTSTATTTPLHCTKETGTFLALPAPMLLRPWPHPRRGHSLLAALMTAPPCLTPTPTTTAATPILHAQTQHLGRGRKAQPPGQRAHSSSASIQARVRELAATPITPVTLEYLASLAASRDLARCAAFVHQEIPKRVARRIRDMEALPYIVGVNPHIRSVYALYLRSFTTLLHLPPPTGEPGRQELLRRTLHELTEQHQDVIPRLARGFKECGKYMSKDKATTFLDGMIHARIGIRVIAEHYLSLSRPPERQFDSYLGVVNTRTSPAHIVRAVAQQVQELCEFNYGSAPDFHLLGDPGLRVAYIGNHLEYILMELLKNAMRATVEYSETVGRPEHPVLQIALAKDETDVYFRIRDAGGGISPADLPRIFDYSFTTVPEYAEASENIFSSTSRQAMINGTGGPIAGLGFGLAISRIYGRGELDIPSCSGAWGAGLLAAVATRPCPPSACVHLGHPRSTSTHAPAHPSIPALPAPLHDASQVLSRAARRPLGGGDRDGRLLAHPQHLEPGGGGMTRSPPSSSRDRAFDDLCRGKNSESRGPLY
jgi:hypothetical protein